MELVELEMFGTVHLYLYLTPTRQGQNEKKGTECLFLLPTAAARVAKRLRLGLQ